MEQLFKNNGISLLLGIDDDGDSHYVAYTDGLLSRNILIKFRTAVMDDSDEAYEEETSIQAITYTETLFYTFALYVTSEVVGPLIIYRIIADAIDFLENIEPGSEIEHLKAISTGGFTSADIGSVREQEERYRSDVDGFKEILEAIKKHR